MFAQVSDGVVIATAAAIPAGQNDGWFAYAGAVTEGWQFDGHTFTPPPPEPVPPFVPDPIVVWKSQAINELYKSDLTILRCVEAGIAVPTAWQEYRTALRVIAASGVGTFPTRPDYP